MIRNLLSEKLSKISSINVLNHQAVNHLVDYGHGWFNSGEVGFNCRLISSRNKILDLNGRINKFIQSDYVIVFSGTIPGYSGLVCFV